MELFVVLFFILFFAVLAKNIAQFFKNEASPRLTVPALIVDKQRKTHHHHAGGHHHHKRKKKVIRKWEFKIKSRNTWSTSPV